MATGSEAVTEGAAKKDYIMEHLLDSAELHLPPPWHHLHLPHIELFGIDVSITRHVVMMWVAALILIVTFTVTTRRRGLVPSGLSNALEAIVQYIREEIAVPNIGKNEAARFMPFLLTVFFFIAGLELKREFVEGSLSRPADALVPTSRAGDTHNRHRRRSNEPPARVG